MKRVNKSWVVYVGSITLGSFLLADITGLALGNRLEASASFLSKPDMNPQMVSAPRGSEPALSSIVEGNIFNSRLRGKKEVFAAPVPAAEVVPDLKARFRLIGTSDGNPEDTFAIIEDLLSKEQSLYHLHDQVLKNVKIALIRRNTVKLAYNGGTETLQILLDEEREFALAPKSSPGGPAQGPGSLQGIRQAAPNRWVLDRQEVQKNLDNLNQLLTQARVVPNFTEGKPDGFKLFSIVPQSFYEKVGLQNGDVLERVNGVEIKDPESFLRVFQNLKDENRISLDLVRNDIKQTLSYEIR
ncbi:MAG TPA: type II secretion system protein GspC [Nitrospiria bacterium]|nr:type II secretion system protein GspC [Nitrospiria bacterium]